MVIFITLLSEINVQNYYRIPALGFYRLLKNRLPNKLAAESYLINRFNLLLIVF